MPIVATDLVMYHAADRPEDDVSSSGGAIDTAARPLEAQFSAAALPEIVSDNAGDSMNVTIDGRDAAGVFITETNALNGVTEVLFAASFERILNINIASAPAGTVTVAQGASGTVRHTFNPAETDAAILFQRAASDPSLTKTRYEKVFWKNEHGSLALTDAEVTLITDTSNLYEIAVSDSIDDTEAVTDREDAPSGESFVDDDVAAPVPGGDLGFGEAIGVWVKQTLGAGAAPAKTTAEVQLAGNTT
jgi:hypothetical protein